jgi:hypothetical protein
MARWEAQQAQWRTQAAALCAVTGKDEKDLTLSRGKAAVEWCNSCFLRGLAVKQLHCYSKRDSSSCKGLCDMFGASSFDLVNTWWEAQQAQWRAQAAALCAVTGKDEKDLVLSRDEPGNHLLCSSAALEVVELDLTTGFACT